MPDIEAHERPSTVPPFSAALFKPKYWPTWLSMPLLYVLSWLPAKLIDIFAAFLGDTVLRRNRKRFHIAKTNLSLCFPEKSDDELVEMVDAHNRAQARAILQYPKLWWQPRALLKRSIDLLGYEQVEAVRAGGENAIVLLCHSASLDVAIAALSMRTSGAGAYKPVRNAVLDWLIATRRMRFGAKVYARDDGLRPLIKSVRNGGLLVYPADEDLGVISKCVFAPFYGVQKATVPVLGRMAKLTDSKVFTCISYYDFSRSRYVVRVLPYIENLQGEDDAADAVEMNASIEQAINYSPEQYLWTLRLFQTRPENEPSVY
jgi:lauroyl-KDO2-lipid IV(A) myristoyltransferase